MSDYHETTYALRDYAHTFGMRTEFVTDVLLGLEPTSMDAPDSIPSGSSQGLECPGIGRFASQRTTYRDGWRA